MSIRAAYLGLMVEASTRADAARSKVVKMVVGCIIAVVDFVAVVVGGEVFSFFSLFFGSGEVRPEECVGEEMDSCWWQHF